MKLAIGRHWRCLSRPALTANSARFTAPSFYLQSPFSTTSPDPTSKKVLHRVRTSLKSQGGSVLIVRYRIGVCTSLISTPCQPVSRPSLAPRLTPGFSLSMLQKRSSSTSASKGDDARSTGKNTPSTSCDHSHEHPNDHLHSHSVFHSHSHDDHDHTHSAEQIVHVFEGKGVLSFAECTVLAQYA